MTDLITKLEAAECGSRELDAEVARMFGWTQRSEPIETREMGRPCGWWVDPDRPDDRALFTPEFTTSLDAALALAEKVLPNNPICMDRMPDGSGWAQVRGAISFNAKANTPALALCIAILRAKQDTPS